MTQRRKTEIIIIIGIFFIVLRRAGISWAFLLIVTLAVSATVFEILTPKGSKSLNFLTPPFFEAPVRGNPLEFRDEIWRQQTRVAGLPDGEEIMTLAFFVLTQYWRVTDGRTDGHVAITNTRASIASRG